MTQPKKVLHVEDNPANRLLVRQVLERAGYQVIEAVDGLSGIKTAQDERPDLILMDINIPGMDGFETATRLKSMPALFHIPIIALTARVMSGDRERALTAGCDGYLPKPINVEKLPIQIGEFMAGRRDKVALEQQEVYLREYNERLVDRLEQKVRELTTANQSLARTDTMKSRFIDLAAHELRTPLTAIQGYLSILTAPGSSMLANANDHTKDLIEGIVTGVDRLRGIVQDMLDVTRLEAGTLQLHQTPLHLPQVYHRIQRDFAKIIEQRKHQLFIAEAGHIPTIWADGERIAQILRNLVGNAIKFTPDGGKINLTTEILGGPLPRSGDLTNHFVKITVSDNGVGVSPEQQERIFKTFHEVREIKHHSTSKTDFMGSGTGLGLPIARGVAEAHGGSLWVESAAYDPESCPGSRFHLILPFGRPPQD